MVLYKFSSNRPTEGRAIIQPLSIAFGEGASSTIGYSADGINWSASITDAFSTRSNYGCWNGKVWVSVGTGGNWVATSYDGINWTGQDSTLLSEGYYVSWNGTVFLAAGIATSSTPQTTFATSADGFSWTAVATDIFYGGYSNWVGWTGNVWCATGNDTFGGNTCATCYNIYGNVWTTASLSVTTGTPFITPNGVCYQKKSPDYSLIYADRTNTPVIPAIFGESYYTDISCSGAITCFAYDGINCIVGTGTNLYYTADFGKKWNATTVTSETVGMQFYGAAFNGKYFILGGGDGASGNVLFYGKSENGINTWYPGLGTKKIFTKVRGIYSNSGYGFVVPNNSVYLDLGDKMNIITPKVYSIGGGDVQIAVNLNTFPVSF